MERKPTHISFSFVPGDPGVREFFDQELEALIRAAAGLMILGYECQGVDFAGRRVYFGAIDQQDPGDTAGHPGAPAEKPEPSPGPAVPRQCGDCGHFSRTSPVLPNGHCGFHGFVTPPDDVCSQWKPKDLA